MTTNPFENSVDFTDLAADSTITVNLDAIVENWRFIDSLSSPKTKTAAMVKANGYGLGSGAVASALARAGAS